MMILAVMMVMTISANAMSYNAAKHEALFLSDKMAYELNLTAAQYEAVYEINLDYLMSLNGHGDVDGWSPPDAGIFSRHLDYCKWYATQCALRMMDVTANYAPDFIYTDGTVQGPFTGNGTGTGYKCNAMQTVMADYYNRVLKKRGKVDAFSIIKFRSPTNGAVNTAE